jgi:hypothetical protein
LNGFVNWLTATPWSIALHESLYMYSLTESVHVMAIMVFVGTIAMIDLRVLGVAYKDAPMSQMLSRILPWTAGGFAVLVITGLMLFYAIPIRTWHSIWFRMKVVLLIVGMANAAFFTFVVERDKATWDLGPTPTRAKISSVLSLTVWILVITFGRLIAYNWTDCDHTTWPFMLQIEDCAHVPLDE